MYLTQLALQDDGTPNQYDLPTPTKAGALAPPSLAADGEPPVANGHLSKDETARYTEQVGWAPQFHQVESTEADTGESLLDHQTFLESKIDDKFFGGESVSAVWYRCD